MLATQRHLGHVATTILSIGLVGNLIEWFQVKHTFEAEIVKM